MNTLLLVATLLLGGPAHAEDVPAATADGDPTVEELLNASDDVFRGSSSHAVVSMDVKTKRYERSMKMESWSLGTEKSLIKILEPAKDAGVATLKVEDNLWNYLPKVDRTMKIPAGMMSGSWMGSHFSNDDLVRESRFSEDFDTSIQQRPAEDGSGTWVIELVPKPDAPVVWGKVVIEVRPDKVPVKATYWDEKGELVRTMTWEEPFDIGGGRMVPRHMRMVPAEAPDEYTKVTYDTLELDADVDEGLFSLQALRK